MMVLSFFLLPVFWYPLSPQKLRTVRPPIWKHSLPQGGPKGARVTKTSFGTLLKINSSRKWLWFGHLPKRWKGPPQTVDYFMPQAIGTTIFGRLSHAPSHRHYCFCRLFHAPSHRHYYFRRLFRAPSHQKRPPPGSPKGARVTKTSFGALWSINSSRKWQWFGHLPKQWKNTPNVD